MKKYRYTITQNQRTVPFFVVAFESNGGEFVPNIQVLPGETVVLPQTSRQGYEFTNWYSDPELTQIFESNPVSADITLYAGWQAIVGETVYSSPGTYTFVVPDNIYSISAVAIGGGQSGQAARGSSNRAKGGSGGYLRYKNNIPVTPNQSVTVYVGAGGASVSRGSVDGLTSGLAGQNSFVQVSGTTVLRALGGNSLDGANLGDGGGTNGRTPDAIDSSTYTITVTKPDTSLAAVNYINAGGGGGAAGYSGNGGNGGFSTDSNGLPTAGSGGGGAGGHSARVRLIHDENGVPTTIVIGNSGGGTGLYGEGTSGTIVTDNITYDLPSGHTTTATYLGSTEGGQSGSGGNTSDSISTPAINLYGGGGGGAYQPAGASLAFSGAGGNGAVRIIWGDGRSFPSTDVGPTA